MPNLINQLDTLEAAAAGKLTVTEAAAALGVSEAEVARKLELLELAGAMHQRQARTLKRKVGAAVAGLGAVVAVIGSVWLVFPAWAAGPCAQTLPAPLVTFCPNSPAVASELNTDFQQLVTWIQAKTGTITNAAITTPALISNGTVRGRATIATQGFELDWNRSGGTGETDLINYRDQGAGGFHFLNGSTLLGALDNTGALTLNTVNAGVANLTTVNGRRPAFTSQNNCSTANCTGSCAPGVIKMGLGFHGSSGSVNVNSQFACGNGITWLGSCIGQQTCTLTTGCGTSAVFLECW